MSEMRDVNGRAVPGSISETIRQDGRPAGTPRFNDSGGLANFRHQEVRPTSRTARLAGAAIVVLMLIGAGVYAYTASTSGRQTLFSPPRPVAANARPSVIQTAPAPNPASP